MAATVRKRRLTLREEMRLRLRDWEHRPLPAGLRAGLVRRLTPDPFEERSAVGPDGRTLVFVHVPKTGGTSLADALGIRSGHVPVSRFRAHDAARFADAFSFAFVRNPWDRLYSSYNYLRTAVGVNASPDVRWAESNLMQYGDFEGFVLALKELDYRRRIMLWPHFRPMRDWICIPGHDKPEVDFVGRFETLNDDLATLCAELGLSVDLPHNRKPQAYLEKRFTPEMIDVIGDIYKCDRDTFGYDFPPSEQGS